MSHSGPVGMKLSTEEEHKLIQKWQERGICGDVIVSNMKTEVILNQ